MAEHLYFAYGSNMNQAEMLDQCPSARFVGCGRLNGWRLVFTRDSARWLGAVADIVKVGSEFDTLALDPAGTHRTTPAACPLSPVRGVLWDLDGADLTALHAAQGYTPGGPPEENDSALVKLDVLLVGAMTQRVSALAFTIVHKEKRHRMPHDGYMQVVVNGARQHGVPDDYVHALIAVDTLGEDPRYHSGHLT